MSDNGQKQLHVNVPVAYSKKTLAMAGAVLNDSAFEPANVSQLRDALRRVAEGAVQSELKRYATVFREQVAG